MPEDARSRDGCAAGRIDRIGECARRDPRAAGARGGYRRFALERAKSLASCATSRRIGSPLRDGVPAL